MDSTSLAKDFQNLFRDSGDSGRHRRRRRPRSADVYIEIAMAIVTSLGIGIGRFCSDVADVTILRWRHRCDPTSP
jgi:hypothetical protein